MAEDRGTLRRISWPEFFPGVLILRTPRMAANFRALLFAALAITATAAGWRLIAAGFWGDEAAGRVSWPWQETPQVMPVTLPLAPLARPFIMISNDGTIVDGAPLGPMDEGPAAPPLARFLGVWNEGRWWLNNPIVHAWQRISADMRHVFHQGLTARQCAYYLLCGLWSLIVWALLGGAISRMAAVALAREEQLSIGHALRYARSKWAAYFSAPLFPLAGAMLATLFLTLVGLLLRFDAGVLIAGLLWPLVLLAGLFMAILLVGLLFGWPLMWSAISTEGTDSFDALSRSYAYTYHRPFYYMFYVGIAAALGILAWVLVSIFSAAVISLAEWGVTWGSGLQLFHNSPTDSQNTLVSTGALLIHFWTNCVVTLTWAFVYSYFWTATTAIYFLLRRHVDATELDEVFLADEETLHGLPPLATDAAGVPGVADELSANADGGASGGASVI